MEPEEIKSKYNDLLKGDLSHQKRGFEFERLINAVLENENLEPRTGYKPKGEQIDGSFFWESRTFLLEAKWVESKLPASSIYSFKGKLDGKFHTSSGIFISVNGYSDDIEEALKLGKSLNIILFDGSDISLIFENKVSFLEILKFKLRQAGDTGSLLVPYNLKEKVSRIKSTKPESALTLKELEKQLKAKPYRLSGDLLVFVEGKSDIKIAHNILKPLSKIHFLSYKIECLNGFSNIRQLPSLLNMYGDTKAVIVMLDDDQMTNTNELLIESIREQISNSPNPTPASFFFVSDTLKKLLIQESTDIDVLRNHFAFNHLEVFIRQIADDYYDPDKIIPLETLRRETQNLYWNFDEGIIEYEDEQTGHTQDIKTIIDLVSYLEEAVVQAMVGEMPSYWIKEQESYDYESLVREYLYDNYKDEIKKMNWDVNEL